MIQKNETATQSYHIETESEFILAMEIIKKYIDLEVNKNDGTD